MNIKIPKISIKCYLCAMVLSINIKKWYNMAKKSKFNKFSFFQTTETEFLRENITLKN